MAEISTYVDPGSYQQEKLNPTSLGLSPLSLVLAIVGIAPRVKPVSNEAVRRGQVSGETLTFTTSPPYIAVLAQIGNRRQQDTVLVRNGTDVLPDIAYVYLPATLTGVAGPFAIAADTYLTFSLDQKPFISVLLTAGGTQTAAQIAADINAALLASSDYGVAYSTAATTSGASVVLTSPLAATPYLSDLRFIATAADVAPASAAVDGSTTVFGLVLTPIAGFSAAVRIQLNATYYSGTATYTVSYIALNTLTDPLFNTPVVSIEKIGNVANVTSYQPTTDYTLTGNTVDWTVNTQATLTSVAGPFAIVLNVNDKLRFSLNGLPVVTITLTAGGARTAAQIAAELNFFLAGNANYGSLYAGVAVNSSGSLVLTMPKPFNDIPLAQGVNSTIEFFDTPANAVTTIFNIASASLPFEGIGVGDQPTPGAVYFVSYTYTRPASDYNSADTVNHLFLRSEDALAYTGAITADNLSFNKLGIAAEIAFENNASRVLLIQVNDTTSPGFPTINQFKAAIDAAADNEAITDLVALDTRVSVQTYLLNHVTVQSSVTEKNYRRGWYGMARNTPVGDTDTAGTFLYAAGRTLQVPPDSPGRGRSVLVAPPNVSRTITLADASERNADLDSTYLSVAIAGKQTSFVNASTTLLRKTVTGFNTDTFQVYQKAERRLLASNGVCVVTLSGGNLVLTDPITTEVAGGNVIEFTEISAGVQKDRLVRVVDRVVDTNLVGVVPDDIADFITDVKGFIADAIRGEITAGNIGRYVTANGQVRDINLSTDIQVFQDPNDPTKFHFRYFFNLRYPAKRFFGTYSVDNPFFAANSSVSTA